MTPLSQQAAPQGRSEVGQARRLTLVITTLSTGGAERVLSTMANHWAEQGREVTFITLDAAEEDFFPLHAGVRRVALDLAAVSRHSWDALRNNLGRVRALRRAIKASRPDAVISFTDRINVLTLLATWNLPVPVIISERLEPMQQPLTRVWAGMRHLLYPRADAIVVQTESVRRWAAEFVSETVICTIPNPVALRSSEDRPAGDSSATLLPVNEELPHTVVAMGRLSPEKGFDLLLRAFARCQRKHWEWGLVILGEGPERGRLEALAAELGIANAVRLPGPIAGPETVLRQADLFVMSSHCEGFPNALLEAMACRLPVISTDCPSGPREIVRDGIDGILVPPRSVDALAAAMQRLISAPQERERLRSRAVEVRERFALDQVMGQWEQLLESVVPARRKG